MFLDEIDSLNLELQSKLLRVLDEKCVTRLGSVMSVPLNVRIITTANADLSLAVAEGHFRRDLYHRLNIIDIHVPPIRERGDDVLKPLDYFLEQECFKAGKKRLNVSSWFRVGY